MQFISNGPDIPDALLQAHEEGRVVFFCGAGISYPADLPPFKGLTEQIYRLSGTELSDIERGAFERNQFDATLDLLERRLPGQRLAVRQALAKALTPKLRRKGAIDTQAALLRLARSREGALRLVTTNFDRIFHIAAKRTSQAFHSYAAPMLPIPKSSRWDGLVFLHGLLPEKADDTALNRLVVTSGDFGLAYLTERWAARFVSELFRNYVVCFVGYSLDDPVLRYMMDALAADRMLGEVTPQAWAFGSCEAEQEHAETIKWQAKGVIPVLYSNKNNHSSLHQTLHAWAETYRDGVQGKEAIVVKHALTRPQESTQQDNFIGRMLWALSDKSGLPARRFADFNPVPSLDWLLESFAHEHFGHSDLSRFGVPPRDEIKTKLRFSLIRRPAPHDRAPPMLLVSGGTTDSQWDDVMFHLARWLVRHLDDPRLLIWISEQGGKLHDRWHWLIENELDRFASLEREGKTSVLNEIRLHAPKAIPSPLMRTLWRLLLSDCIKSPMRNFDLYRWKDRLTREGLTATLRLELRNLLAPKVILKKPFHWGEDDSSSADKPARIKQLVDWEITLAADHVHSAMRDLADEHWKSALPRLLDDFQQLLRDALDLLHELGEADDKRDRSNWDLPSITPHWQNRGFRDWVSLIELLRDAWLAIRATDKMRATKIAQYWFELPYSTFKRLALFAASQDDCITPVLWVEWLVSDSAWWLWSTDTRREMSRLLVLQGRNLSSTAQRRLEAAILAGPPREMYRDDLEDDRWDDIVTRSVWLHLAKLNTSSLVLSAAAAARLAAISSANPKWKLATNESDEFSSWMSGTGDPDYEESRVVDIAPRKRQDLVQWLKKESPKDDEYAFYKDTWQLACQKHPLNCLFALADLATQQVWPHARWRDALYAWGSEKMIRRMWRYAASHVDALPNSVIEEINHGVSSWVQAASKSTNCHEDIFLNLCSRVLSLPLDADTGINSNGKPINASVTEAINHPVGHITQALINVWFKRNPNDNDQLPRDMLPFFTQLCNVDVERFRHGRVILCANLIALFRVDKPWAERYLLPLLRWSNPVEAKAAWEGFLWSPRLYQPLLTAFKSQFLDTSKRYANLGEHRQQFARFLTYVALGPTDGYTMEEFRSAIGSLPSQGLEESAQAVSQALEGAGDQREDYWRNRVQPFWQSIWPKSRDLATRRIAESLTRLAIAARGEFPAAMAAVKDWLQPIEHPNYVVRLLHESALCSKCPADALSLLNAVIADQQWAPRELGKCLDQIVKSAPNLLQDAHYLKLREYFRRRAI